MIRHGWRHLALALAVASVTDAPAQVQPPPATAPDPADPTSPAPAPAARPAWTFSPSIGIIETHSDNVAAVSDAVRRSGWITDLTPGLRIEAAGSRVRGFLDYRLHDLRYSSDSSLDSRQNLLQSRFTVDAIRNFASVEARADITQESRTPFGAAPASGASTASANRVETTVLQVAPWVRGTVGDYAQYQLRSRVGEVRTDDGTIPDTRTTEWSGRLGSASGGTRFGWALEGSTMKVRSDAIGTLDDSRIRARLFWTAVPTLRFVVSGGVDETDFAGPPTQRDGTAGAGVSWIPSERTQFAALYERRGFGDGFTASFTHRTGRTSWILSATRDAAVLPGLTAIDTRASLADLAGLLIASSSPDPEVRAARARESLSDSGLAAGPVLGSSLLASRPVVYKRADAAALFQGLRSTFALRYGYLEQRAYGPVSLVGAGFAGDQDLERHSADASWSYRLTPATTATLVAARLETHGLQADTPDTRQTFLTAALTTRLGPRTTASAGVRRTDFGSSAPGASYRENAVYVQLTARF